MSQSLPSRPWNPGISGISHIKQCSWSPSLAKTVSAFKALICNKPFSRFSLHITVHTPRLHFMTKVVSTLNYQEILLPTHVLDVGRDLRFLGATADIRKSDQRFVVPFGKNEEKEAVVFIIVAYIIKQQVLAEVI